MPEGCFPVIHFSIERVVAPKANTRFFLSERLNLVRVQSHFLYFFSKVTVSFGYGAPPAALVDALPRIRRWMSLRLLLIVLVLDL